ncbi:MBL fold metallo-hydrolase [Candidatus Peregrinibacteria bacterium]|nr:MAG: MBL fold metallo-hydrolase [Candidatus Peregrinibacteria bacterium]
MFFKRIPVGPMQNNSYLIGCEKTKEALVVDCGFEAEKIQKIAKQNGYTIVGIVLTHVHYDHSGAADALSEITKAPIYAHEKTEKKRGQKINEGMWSIPKKFTPLTEGEEIAFGEESGRVLFAPGHQSDHILFRTDLYLFTGDTLFIEGIGRTDFPDSSSEDMQRTLNTIIDLPENLVICPGHDYGSVPMRKLAEERKYNMYLKKIIEHNN